jgi:PleD family two-component response regulator
MKGQEAHFHSLTPEAVKVQSAAYLLANFMHEREELHTELAAVREQHGQDSQTGLLQAAVFEEKARERSGKRRRADDGLRSHVLAIGSLNYSENTRGIFRPPEANERILASTAKFIRQKLREEDFAGRNPDPRDGRDNTGQLLLFLSDTKYEHQAFEPLKRIQAHITEMSAGEDEEEAVNAANLSIGLTRLPQTADYDAALGRAADALTYARNQPGQNHIAAFATEGLILLNEE